MENNSFSAEYGNNGGTVVNTVMKSGTNQFHGSGWWYGQRAAFDARDFFNTGPVPDHQHDQLASRWAVRSARTRLSSSAILSIVRDREPVNIVATVPTDAERNGDFSQTIAYDANGNLVQNQIFDPFTTDANGNRTAYTGNMVPQSEMGPGGPGDPESVSEGELGQATRA